MTSVMLCHAVEDAALAADIARFLEANCDVSVAFAEGLLSPAALSADVLLVGLSPASAPQPWKREVWESMYFTQARDLNTRVAFLLFEKCRFPELFRRETFFDLSENRLRGLRGLKRWFFEPESSAGEIGEAGEYEGLRQRIADYPGRAEGLAEAGAQGFIERCGGDFQKVLWLDGARRTEAGLAGDLGHALGLELAGDLKTNREAIAAYCARTRCLFVVRHVPAGGRARFEPKGKASVLFVEGEAPAARSLKELTALFEQWPRRAGECLRALGDAAFWLPRAPPSLGLAMLALLRQFHRFAEACEVLEVLIESARRRGDLVAAHRLAWERSTILESSGGDLWESEAGGVAVPRLDQVVAAEASPEPAQLPLPFATPLSGA